MNADPVAHVLDTCTPPFELVAADWDDVLARVRPRRHRRPVALALSAACAAALALVVFWPLAAAPSVLARAAAAIGDKPVLHVVVEDSVGSALVDLRTGRRTPVAGRLELWSDPMHGLRVVRSFRGVTTSTDVYAGRLGRNSGWVTEFATGYRAQLHAHRFHVVRSGVVGGTPVEWIEGQPSWQTNYPGNEVHEYVQQIAISKRTYKPVFERMLEDGRVEPGTGVSVLTIESVPARPALFAHPTTSTGSGWTATSPPLTRADVRARVASPSLMPLRIGGLRLSWQGEAPFLARCCGTGAAEIPGVSLYYGSLSTANGRGDTPGDPAYTGRFVAISEFSRPNAVTRELGPTHFPPEGTAVLDARDVYGAGDHNATLRAHGAYVIIQGSTDADVLAAARMLAR